MAQATSRKIITHNLSFYDAHLPYCHQPSVTLYCHIFFIPPWFNYIWWVVLFSCPYKNFTGKNYEAWSHPFQYKDWSSWGQHEIHINSKGGFFCKVLLHFIGRFYLFHTIKYNYIFSTPSNFDMKKYKDIRGWHKIQKSFLL